MNLSNTFAGAVAAISFAFPSFADDIVISDAYARAAGASAMAGAAFMMIENHGDTDDRLIGASSDIAHRTELHTHIDAGNGVMQMREVENGFVIPAHGTHVLARGADHVMFMGLMQEMVHGETVTVTLSFEVAGDITIDIPIDLERQADMMMQHGDGNGMQHGNDN